MPQSYTNTETNIKAEDATLWKAAFLELLIMIQGRSEQS